MRHIRWRNSVLTARDWIHRSALHQKDQRNLSDSVPRPRRIQPQQVTHFFMMISAFALTGMFRWARTTDLSLGLRSNLRAIAGPTGTRALGYSTQHRAIRQKSSVGDVQHDRDHPAFDERKCRDHRRRGTFKTRAHSRTCTDLSRSLLPDYRGFPCATRTSFPHAVASSEGRRSPSLYRYSWRPHADRPLPRRPPVRKRTRRPTGCTTRRLDDVGTRSVRCRHLHRRGRGDRGFRRDGRRGRVRCPLPILNFRRIRSGGPANYLAYARGPVLWSVIQKNEAWRCTRRRPPPRHQAGLRVGPVGCVGC